MRRWWTSRKFEEKIALVTLVVTILGAIPAYQAFWPRSKVVISVFELTSKKNIDAEWIEEGTDEKTPDKTEGTGIDIILRNRGKSDGLITTAEVTFRQARQLQNCTASGGPAVLKGYYHIKVPSDSKSPKVPFTISHPIKFDVLSGKYERLALTIGPESVSDTTWPWFYEVDITLKQDAGKDLQIKNVFLLEHAYEQWVLFETFRDPPTAEQIKCVRQEANFLQRVVDDRTPGAYYSPELLEFNEGIHKYLDSLSRKGQR